MSDATPTPGGQGAAAPAAPAAAAPAPSTAAALAAPPAAAPAPTSQQLATPPGTPPAAPKWAEGADEATAAYITNKGWDSPVKAIESYRNLEKLLGADKAGNAIVLPKADADPKEWGAVYDRLGRPADIKGYDVKVPEGGDAKFQESMLGVAHELGLSKQQAEGLFGKFNEASAAAVKAAADQKAVDFVAQDNEIKAEWGQAYQQNVATAQAAMRALGLDAATVDKLSDAMGHKATMKLLHTLGAKTGEASYVDGKGGAGFSGAMTPAQATERIKTLMADKAWATKYINGGAPEKAEMERLHKFKAGMPA